MAAGREGCAVGSGAFAERVVNRGWVLAGLSVMFVAGCAANPATDEPVVVPVAADICDVQVSPTTSNGISFTVAAPGPDVVQVDIWNGVEHRRLTQQVTKNAVGASFTAWDFAGFFDRVTVKTRRAGTCEVSADVLARLNGGRR